MIDRLAYGAVFDFIQLHVGDWSWYVFNVADAAIVAGVVGLLYDSFVLERRRMRRDRGADRRASRHMFARLGGSGVRPEWEYEKVGAMKGLKVFGCAGALALLVAATGASAQEGEAVKSLLGSIGIIPKEKPPINYSERAPLVLPPKMELRAPARSAQRRDPTPTGRRIPTSPPPARPRPRRVRLRPAREAYEPTQAGVLSVEEMRAGRNPNNYVQSPPAADRRPGRQQQDDPGRTALLHVGEEAKLSGDGLERRYLSDPPAPLLKAQGGGQLKASVDDARWSIPTARSASSGSSRSADNA